MKDPVALAYSGRIPEALAAAVEQASSDDDFLVAQGLEALAVLGQQHGVRTNAAIDALLVRLTSASSTLSRKAFDAAMSVGSRVLEDVAVQRLESGAASWEVMRYAGEWPSHRLGRALLAGWARVPERLRDEALLTCCVMPVSNAEEAAEFGQLAIDASRDGSNEIRVAAFRALRWWAPLQTADICARALRDRVEAVRRSAADTLAFLEPQRLIDLAAEYGDEAPEAVAAVKTAQAELLRRSQARRRKR